MGSHTVLLSLIFNFSLLFAQPVPLCTNNGLAGPGTCSDNVLARYDGTNSHILQCSDILVDDFENVSGIKTLTVSDLTTDRALYSDSGDALTSSATTATQLAYLSSFSSNLTTAGDIFYHNGTNITRLPVGNDNDILKVDTGIAGKINWEAAAGGGNSFETFDADAGTNPVADSSTDTLLVGSSDSSVTITGNSATDALDFVTRYSNPTNDTTNECFGVSAICGTNGASAGGNTAIGNGSEAGDTDSGNSTSIGKGASCTGGSSVCIGAAAIGTGDNQIIIGASQDGAATNSVVNIGSLNTCTGDVCIGVDSDGLGSKAINIGASCDSEEDTPNTVCIGQNNTVGDGESDVGFGVAIGTSNTVSWGYGIAIGRSNVCAHASVCIGRAANSSAHQQIVFGGSTLLTDMWIGAGVSQAAAANVSINTTADTGTNIAGHSMTISSGAGTGTGSNTNAGIAFRTPDTTGSGTTSQTLTTKMEVKGTGVIYYTPKATAPATCTLGEFYFDTSGAACFCTDAANTWTNTTGIGTCA